MKNIRSNLQISGFISALLFLSPLLTHGARGRSEATTATTPLWFLTNRYA